MFFFTAMAFSIPFLIITMICYYYLTRPYGTNCKCFITYLSLVTISYTLICSYTISRVVLPSIICQIFGTTKSFFSKLRFSIKCFLFFKGFLVYYTIAGYLTWTCILSYDTWKTLTDIAENQPSFAFYSLIGWSIPTILSFLTFLCHISPLPEDWKPGMDSNMCAVNSNYI